MHLMKTIPMLTDDAEGMQRICKRVHARRLEEANTLPPLESCYQAPPAPRPNMRGAIMLVIATAVVGWGFAAWLVATAPKP